MIIIINIRFIINLVNNDVNNNIKIPSLSSYNKKKAVPIVIIKIIILIKNNNEKEK